MSNREIEEFAAFAGALADAAAAVTLRAFRDPGTVTNKAEANAAFDPVTKADRDAEQTMRALIAKHHPAHGLIGEEHGARAGTAPYEWVLDPIDGTRSFVSGLPLWGTLIGLLHDGLPVLGLMDQPYMGERFIGHGGTSHLHRGAERLRLATSPCRTLHTARLATTDPDLFAGAEEKRAFDALRARARMTRYGGDCYLYCMLASGCIDLVFESGLHVYDIAPLIPIIEGAGGVVSNWKGGSAAAGGQVIAAATRALHQEALELTAG